MIDLEEIALEIRNILENKREEFNLQFFEDEHKYIMKDLDGNIRTDFPSVSKVLKNFYDEFPAEEIALQKARGNLKEQQRLLDEWKAKGDSSTNMGSRIHYYLEKELVEIYNLNKEVREPFFECDIFQTARSESMIEGGKKYIELCDQRNLTLVDTEIVLGHPELGYTGQPDKVWLTLNATGDEFGLLITDWKSNQPKNFQVNQYTKSMKSPFDLYPNNALGHYYLQLPFYGKLIIKMLEGTKYENIKLFGCIVVLLTEEKDFVEYRVPKDVISKILTMDMKHYLLNT
jgi:hypothetical protein